MRRVFPLAALVVGHFVTDCYMGMISPLLPFVKERLNLSLFWMGTIPVFASLTASLAQPVFGWVCDRTRGAYLVGLGVACTGVGICTFGTADSFGPMMILLALGGLGCGSFHPAGAALASIVGGKRRDLALAVFSPGGITGYSAGPVVAIWLYNLWGLDGMWPAMAVGLVLGPAIGAVAWRIERREKEAVANGSSPTVNRAALEMPRAKRLRTLTVLLGVVFLRSAVVIVFIAYLAEFLKGVGVPPDLWGYLVGGFSFGGGVSGLIGGALANTIGRRRLTVATLALTGPVLLAFVHLDSPVRWALLILGGALAQMAVPANIVQSQILLPTRQSLASALTMGFCWGTAAMLAPVFGSIADRTSLPLALSLACVLPLLSAALALFVPDLRDDDTGAASSEPPVLPPTHVAEVGEG